jgi:hypothetical protein
MRIDEKRGKVIHRKTSLHTGAALEHKIKGKLTGQLDEPVIACFSNDEDALNVGLDASTALRKGSEWGGYRRGESST